MGSFSAEPSSASDAVPTPDSPLEVYTHSLLFSRAQRYVALRDYESAIFLAERVVAALREQIRSVAAEALAAEEESIRAQQGSGGGGVPSASPYEPALRALSCSLEAVQHLLALAQYHAHNSRARIGRAGAGGVAGAAAAAAAAANAGGSAPGGLNASALGAGAPGGSGASYAYQLLQTSHAFTEENQFFYAQCCAELGKLPEAEAVLLRHAQKPLKPVAGPLYDAAADVVPPQGAHGLLLLGQVCQASARLTEAAAFYHRALHADPLLWSAYAALCSLGVLNQSALGPMGPFRVDVDELAASFQAQETEQQPPQPPQPHPSAGPRRSPRDPERHARLLDTPASSVVPHLHLLSIHTPAPRQPVFATPMTGANSAAAAATAAAPASPFVTPPPAGASSNLTPRASPARAAGRGFSSPPTSAMKVRARGHVRAHSASSTGSATSASTAAPVSSSSARARKPSSSRLYNDGSADLAAARTGSEYSSDDATMSERERNEKKLGRRINRGQTPGEKQAKTPRLDRADAPTTAPRRGGNSALLSAKKVTPAARRASAAASSSSHAAGGGGAPLKSSRLPEIVEQPTPESQSDTSGAAASPHPAVRDTPMVGTNLLQALQTPSLFETPAVGGVPVRGHARSRSHSSTLPFATSGEQQHPSGSADELMGTSDGEDAAEEEDDEEDEERAQLENHQQEQEALRARFHSAAAYLTNLLQTFAEGYRLQTLFSCPECLSVYRRLPPHHYHSSFVFRSMARALFEIHRYTECISLYREAREMSPGREDLRGVEFLSTALWQRGDATALAQLAHEVLAQDSAAPESWIVVGNSFSLAREHELALKFFRRAIQTSGGRMAYAYTLSAHEYVSNDELDRAATGYRLAINMDPRAYGAWYGLGNLILKQEKPLLALSHFQRALKIHPTSSVLHAFRGVALGALKRYPAALESFSRAEELDPTNALAKFHTAHTLLNMGRLDEARERLQLLEALVPREAHVHLLLGRVLKRLGDRSAALTHFITALELDPKDRTAIKAAIENIHGENADSDEDPDAAEI